MSRRWRVALAWLGLIFIGSGPIAASADNVLLAWTAPTTYENAAPLTVAGYHLYSGCASSGQYERPTLTLGAVTSYDLGGLPSVGTCYFALDAFDSSGVASLLSAEAQKLMGLPPLPGDPSLGPTITWLKRPMAIAFVDADTGVDGTSSGVTVTPALGAPASGTVIYIAVNWIANSAGAWPSSYTLTGFTQVAKVDATSNFGELVLFRKVAGGSEPTSYTVTWTGGTFYNVSASLIVLSGVDNTTPEGTPASTYDSTSDTSFSIPALTTTVDNSWDLAVVGLAGDAAGAAGPILSSWGSSLIERTDRNEDFAATGMATALRSPAGLQAATSVTGTTQRSLAIRVEVFPSGGGGGGAFNAVPVIDYYLKMIARRAP